MKFRKDHLPHRFLSRDTNRDRPFAREIVGVVGGIVGRRKGQRTAGYQGVPAAHHRQIFCNKRSDETIYFLALINRIISQCASAGPFYFETIIYYSKRPSENVKRFTLCVTLHFMLFRHIFLCRMNVIFSRDK